MAGKRSHTADGSGVSPFEAIRHEDDGGGEYWSARELAKVLGYSKWANFQPTVEDGMKACETSGQPISDHFLEVRKMVPLGSGAQRSIQDFHLSRYACYLVVMNGDPSKPIVAAGQTYFAVQTRRAQLMDEMAQLPEEQRRIRIRNEVVDRNVELAAAAHDAGVVTGRDFAIFQDHGYRGLYDGETSRDIAARKGLAKGEKILDWMGSEELAANWFRITQTEAKIRRESERTGDAIGKDAANATHHAVGRAVRETIQQLGGTMPEDLPTPPESVKQLERREHKRLESERQPSLFHATETEEKA